MSELQLSLAPVAHSEVEVVDAEPVTTTGSVAPAVALSSSPPPPAPRLEARNLFGEAERIAARAATPSTRRQYGAIFRAFGDWLAGELGRPPVAGDFDADVIGAYGRERGVPVPQAVQHALEAWTAVHPLARRIGLLDEQSLCVRLGRHGDEEPLPLSAVAVHRLVRRSCLAAGVPERLAHPHALRAYWATHLLEDGVPIHEVSARLGHVDLRTTARYAAPRPERVDEIAELLDRRHHAAWRAGWGA